MAAGKVYDVMINGQSTYRHSHIAPYSNALPFYDRELSLSGNATERDAGMLAYISINGGALPAATGAFAPAVAAPTPITRWFLARRSRCPIHPKA